MPLPARRRWYGPTGVFRLPVDDLDAVMAVAEALDIRRAFDGCTSLSEVRIRAILRALGNGASPREAAARAFDTGAPPGPGVGGV